MQKKKILTKILIILIPLIFVCGIYTFLHWNHFSNKNTLFQKYRAYNKDVYVLGTIGKNHFKKGYDYSMKNMLSVIESVDPDLTLIQAREDHYIQYGIIDGNIDACVAYSFCFENKIPFWFVDWWIVDNIYPGDATTNLRDDNIFIKVSRQIKEAEPGSKILLLIDSREFYEITSRFKVAGYKQLEIEDKSSYFVGKEEKFKFPAVVAKTWRDRNYFFAYNFPTEVCNLKDLNEDIKSKFKNADHDSFYLKEIEYCKYLNNDILFK